MPQFRELFSPITLGNLNLRNRIAMAPMTRYGSPRQTPGEDVATYYKKRAEGNVGLIITEGTSLRDPSSTSNGNVPTLEGEPSIQGWTKVVRAVQAAGGAIFCQLWHVGAIRKPEQSPNPDIKSKSPSGLFKPNKPQGIAMSAKDIEDTIEDYARAAAVAQKIGFDGIEIHGAHGYLIDQFFWQGTNQRHDSYGGSLQNRAEFASKIITAARKATSKDYPIALRFSQWKQQDYTAKLTETPKELEQFCTPLVEAGVDIFHCSTRRIWDAEFEGSPLNLAGWTKKITGKATISVGSVGLQDDFIATYGQTEESGLELKRLEGIEQSLALGEYDLVAVGRALIANPDWPLLVAQGNFDKLKPYNKSMLASLS